MKVSVYTGAVVSLAETAAKHLQVSSKLALAGKGSGTITCCGTAVLGGGSGEMCSFGHSASCTAFCRVQIKVMLAIVAPYPCS